jgi:hypothetical protein
MAITPRRSQRVRVQDAIHDGSQLLKGVSPFVQIFVSVIGLAHTADGRWCGFDWRAPEGGLITATTWPASIPRAGV